MIDSGHYMHDADALSRIIYESPVDFFQIFFGLGDVETLNEKYLYTTTYWSHNKGWIFSDTRNVIRVNAIFQWLAFHNQQVVLLFNTVICLMGLRWIYQGLENQVSKKQNWLFVLLFFLPSTLLWTANLSKEAFLIFGLGLVFRNMLTNKTVHFGTAAGLIFILLFKPYVGIALLFALLIYIFSMLNSHISRWISLGAFLAGVVLIVFMMRFNIADHISKKQFDFINLAEGGVWIELDGNAIRIEDSDTIHLEIWEAENKNLYATVTKELHAEKRVHKRVPEKIKIAPSQREYYVLHRLPKSGSYITLQPIDGKLSNLIASIPSALFNTFLRPTPKDPPKSFIKWYFVGETYFFLLMLVVALTKTKESKHGNMLLFLGISSMLIGVIIGWTTPVLGAVIRYKLPITIAIVAATWLLLFPKTDPNKKQ